MNPYIAMSNIFWIITNMHSFSCCVISTNSIAISTYSIFLSSRYSKILYNTHTHINIPILFTSIARSPAWATVTAASLPMCFTSRLTARDITDWASPNGNVIIPIIHTPKMQLPKDYKHNKHINKYQHKATVRMWTTSAFLQFSCVEILTSNNLMPACLCVCWGRNDNACCLYSLSQYECICCFCHNPHNLFRDCFGDTKGVRDVLIQQLVQYTNHGQSQHTIF